MKRKATSNPKSFARIGDVSSDFSDTQLKLIGTIAMQYNEVESWIDALLSYVTNVPDALQLEVSTRINGADGKTAIVKIGIDQYGLPEDVQTHIANTLGDGENGFSKLKGYRDAIIHARAYNAPLGVGMRVDRRANVYEVLLTADCLKAVAARLVWLNLDLMILTNLVIQARIDHKSGSSDPGKEQPAPLTATWCARFLSRRNRMQSLPPLPEFPSEEAMNEARRSFIQDNEEALLRYSREVLDELGM